MAASLVEPPQERLNREVQRSRNLFGAFSGCEVIERLVGVVLAKQHVERAMARRYMSANPPAALTQPSAELEAADTKLQKTRRSNRGWRLVHAELEARRSGRLYAPACRTQPDCRGQARLRHEAA